MLQPKLQPKLQLRLRVAWLQAGSKLDPRAPDASPCFVQLGCARSYPLQRGGPSPLWTLAIVDIVCAAISLLVERSWLLCPLWLSPLTVGLRSCRLTSSLTQQTWQMCSSARQLLKCTMNDKHGGACHTSQVGTPVAIALSWLGRQQELQQQEYSQAWLAGSREMLAEALPLFKARLRYGDSQVLYLAAILDPRFKMLDFQFSPAQFSQAEQVLSRLVTVDGSQADQPVAMALEQLRRGCGASCKT
ncbi:hypothetical protein V8C86DRAFT_1334651 [Haematococcus lacustris]